MTEIYAAGKQRTLVEALGLIDEEWVESGESCQQTTIDLRNACLELLVEVNSYRWMTEMRLVVVKEAAIGESWVVVDVDDEVHGRGPSPIDAINAAQAKIEGHT